MVLRPQAGGAVASHELPGDHPALLALAAVGYIFLCALVYVMQERLIFFPDRDPPGTRYTCSGNITGEAQLHADLAAIDEAVGAERR